MAAIEFERHEHICEVKRKKSIGERGDKIEDRKNNIYNAIKCHITMFLSRTDIYLMAPKFLSPISLNPYCMIVRVLQCQSLLSSATIIEVLQEQ